MTTTRRTRQLGNCMRHAKNPYESRQEADADAVRVQGESGVTLYPYECACGWWHLSRRPAEGSDTPAAVADLREKG